MDQTTNLERNAHHHHASGLAADVGLQLLARWPAVLGLLGLLTSTADGADAHVTAMIIIVASVCYLGAAALGSRRGGWVMVVVTGVAVLLARMTGLDQTIVLLVLGAAVAVLGLFRFGAVDRRELGVQALAFIGFSALALTAMMSGPVVALSLAAAAAIGHAVWDVIHFVRDKVVTRSLTEACFLLDLGLGMALLLAAAGVSAA
ncbi:hypothetical protein [Agromyces salentinus]|uniref:Uncharacterized protein n=1 Tax=Agromyces salentinus TaxID=269421 RepID=A0ABN2MJY9_9MICO|nr:hypothetical protein [Agromyces salentinus]